jgi:Domain of unknown function (DUF427)
MQIMPDKPKKIPGPDHPISIDANPSRVVVTVGGQVIADTRDALTLREDSYPAVQYIPRRDVDMAALTRSEHTTIAPTRATLPTTAFRLAGIVPSMRCGLMRPPLKRWRKSGITSPSTRTVSTRSANRRRRPGFGASGRAVRHKAATRSRDDSGLWHTTAYGALIFDAQVKAGDFVIIPAASSSVGLAAIQISNYAGAIAIALTRTADKKMHLHEAGAGQAAH